MSARAAATGRRTERDATHGYSFLETWPPGPEPPIIHQPSAACSDRTHNQTNSATSPCMTAQAATPARISSSMMPIPPWICRSTQLIGHGLAMSITRNTTKPSSSQYQPSGTSQKVIQIPTNSSQTMPSWSHAELARHLAAQPDAEQHGQAEHQQIAPAAATATAARTAARPANPRCPAPWASTRPEAERQVVPGVGPDQGLRLGRDR